MRRQYVRTAPKKVIANHLEALNHCPSTRVQLEQILERPKTQHVRYQTMIKINKHHHAQSPVFQCERLTLVFACYQIFLHGYFVVEARDPRLLLPHVIAGIHDMFLLGILLVVNLLLLRWISGKYNMLASVCLRVGCVLAGMSLASYPRFLREYLVFPVNLFEADIQTTETLIADYVGVTALWPVLLALLLGIGVLFLRGSCRLPRTLTFPVLCLVLIMTGVTLQRPSPHPFLFSLQQEVQALLSNQPRVVPSLKRVVVVSDHGDRAKAAEAENYRVPLLVVGTQMQPQTQHEMLNHLDLPQLILHYAANAPFPESRDQVVVVGSTEKWVYGTITHNDASLFLDDSRGTVMAQKGTLIPSEVHHAFQTRLNAFASRVGM